MSAHDEQQAKILDWQIIRYGDTDATRLALAYYRRALSDLLRKWAVPSFCCMGLACGPTPTAPDPVIILGYAWDRIAPGCTPQTPIPAYTSRTPDRTELLDPGTARAFYLESADRSRPGRTVETFTVGEFKWDHGRAICAWDVRTRIVIAEGAPRG